MKKLLTFLSAALLIFILSATPVYAVDSFLIGDWATRDGGTTFTFRDDGSFMCNFGFLAEEGMWYAQDNGDQSFVIEMEGSITLTIMTYAYGGTNENYHFEVLKCNHDNFYLVQVYGDYTARTSPCKLPLTREGSVANFELPAEGAEQIVWADENEVRIKPVKFNSEHTIDLNWGWNLFNKDSSEYDHDIAMAALTLSQAAEDSQEDAEERLSSLGFEHPSSVYYGGKEDERDLPATTFAAKEIVLNGEAKIIIAVVVRGTGDYGDIKTDFNGMFEGFFPSANNIRERFKEYWRHLEEELGQSLSADNTLLFLTGHSLGGAVAGQLAQMLEGYYGHRETIFAYTFASPNYQTFEYDTHSFTNVHNIVNVNDIVPKGWLGFKKYGHIWYYDSKEPIYKPYLTQVYGFWEARDVHNSFKMTEHLCPTYLAMMLCDTPSNMGTGAVNPYSITSVHCPVDIEIFNSEGTLMGRTNGGEVELEEDSEVLILTDGEEKYVLSALGSPYHFRIIGTGQGEMTVTQQSVDSFSGEILSEKTFETVSVSPSQEFNLDITGDLDAHTASLQESTEQEQASTHDDGRVIASSLEESDEQHQEISTLADEGDFPVKQVLIGLGLVIVLILMLAIFREKKKKRKRRK